MENADEPYAQEIAWEVTDRLRRGEEIATTTQLRQAIEAALSFIPEKERREAVKKSSQRTFQALRIDVNNEYEALYSFLEKLPEVLAPNGRVAILTFHSGEDVYKRQERGDGRREEEKFADAAFWPASDCRRIRRYLPMVRQRVL